MPKSPFIEVVKWFDLDLLVAVLITTIFLRFFSRKLQIILTADM